MRKEPRVESGRYADLGVADPLGHGERLHLVQRFHPLGFPLVLRTNSGDIVAAAQEGWGEFHKAFERTPIELRAVVKGDTGGPRPAAADEPAYRAQGHLLAVVMDRANFAFCDLDRCFGFAWFEPRVARDPLFTSFYFLDVMAYVCLSQRYLTPIHAACVARNGCGILLVGGPQSGKSSLALCCARAGLTYVSDDATWLVRGVREPTLIGKPQRMRFRQGALELLPELARLPRIETVVGKHSFEIRTADIPGLATAAQCRPGRLVFLERRDRGPAELFPVSFEEIRQRLARVRTLLEYPAWAQQEASVEPLLGLGAVGLRYSSMADAVEQILKLA